MDSEMIFRLTYTCVFLGLMTYRVSEHIKAGTFREKFTTPAEGKLIGFVRLVFAVPFLCLLLGYLVYPPLLAWAEVPLPAWARWCGVALTLAVVPLIVWIHRHLGKNFSTTLRVRDDHTLVTTGPYRWVRHPMYTALLQLFAGFFLLTSNVLFGVVPYIMLVFIMMVRTPREERQLQEKFGEAYVEYCRRTGRFLPRLPLAA